MGRITKPKTLNSAHEIGLFDCGVVSLNEWLIKRALKNQEVGASRTFVCCENQRVIGYYALATGSVERLVVPKKMSRNMPEPIPVVILGRLAVDTNFQGKRIGSHLLKDAILRTLNVSQIVGVSSILVHAISEQAKKFYLQYGFTESPLDPMILFLSIKQAENHL